MRRGQFFGTGGGWRAAFGAATLVFVLLLAQAFHGVGWTVERPLKSLRKVEGGKSWRAPLPKGARTLLARQRGVVLEEGRPLMRTSGRRVASDGAGTFAIGRTSVILAPEDDANLHKAPRKFSLRVPRRVPWWWLALAGAAVVATAGLAGAPPAGTPRPTAGSGWRWVLALTVLTLALRVGLWLTLADGFSDGFMMAKGVPYSDALSWLETAHHLRLGEGLQGPFSAQRPLHPLTVAAWLPLGLGKLATAQVINVVLGALGAALAGAWFTRLAGRLAGLALAVTLAALGGQLGYLPLPMTETLSLALLVAALVTLWHGGERKSPLVLLGAGLLHGLSVMANPFTLLGLPALGLVAGAGRDGLRRWAVRTAAVAVGASLVIGAWLVRQKAVHGVAMLSSNSSEMLYAAASPEGRITYDMMREANDVGGADEIPAKREAYYREKLRAAVADDPAAYAGKLFRGVRRSLGTWRHDSPQTVLVLALVLVFLPLTVRQRPWWLVFASVTGPAVAVGLTKLPPAAVLATAATGALLGPAPRVRAAALLLCALGAGVAMDAATGGSLSDRVWSVLDWVPLALFVLAGRNTTDRLDRTQTPVAVPSAFLTRVPAGMAAFCLLSVAITGALTLRGRSSAPAPVPQATIAEMTARFAAESGLPADRLAGVTAWVVAPGEYRCLLRAGESAHHWSRAFEVRAEPRTVFLAQRDGQPFDLATLQVPGDARDLPAAGRFLAIGVRNVDPRPRLGHEPEMLEVLALLPVVDGRPQPEHARVFPPSAQAKTVPLPAK